MKVISSKIAVLCTSAKHLKAFFYYFFKILFVFLQSHTSSCEFVKLPCVHPECGMLVKKADLPQHLETECKCKPETCDFCKKQISLNKMKVFMHSTILKVHTTTAVQFVFLKFLAVTQL